MWNSIRIVCHGPVIQTYLNGVHVSELVDDGERKGIIGLQVHGVGEETTPMSIKWRNLKIMELAANDPGSLLDGETDTLGQVPPRGAYVLLAPGKGLGEWQLRPEKVPWISDIDAPIALNDPYLVSSTVLPSRSMSFTPSAMFCHPE